MLQLLLQDARAVDLEHGTLPDMTGRALRHLAERIDRLERHAGLEQAQKTAGEDENHWFYEI